MSSVNDPWPTDEWRRHLAEALSTLDELLAELELDAAALDIDPTSPVMRRFPLRVPRGFVARMRIGDPHDPLLRQVLPVIAEEAPSPGFSTDPVGELAASPDTGLLRKYRGRALLVVTGACAVNCRYCFRRHFPSPDHAGVKTWAAALVRIAADPSVEEVIFSGGDPLTVTDELLGELASMVALPPHVKRLRIHTRMPIVLPQRVDVGFLEWLRNLPLQIVVVVHANHAREIDDDVERGFAVLRSAGVTLLNQAVLLRGVNDSVDAQCELAYRLFGAGVLPYYLHMLDRVEGAAHFEVPDGEAVHLMHEVRAALPGYLVPRLVREIEGEPYKVPL